MFRHTDIKNIINKILDMKKCKFILNLTFLILSISGLAQQKVITGVVTSANDAGTIPGVSILVKGTSNGTISDFEGKYTITVSENATILQFSFVGMKTIEKEIKNFSVINATMEEEHINLDEYVVIGYGSVKKSDLTGSVSSLKSTKLEKIQANSIDQKLQGNSAGVRVTQLSAQPGGATSIRVRGGNSIMAGNEPLYIIDGVLISGSSSSLSWIGSPSEGVLSSLNPNSIESIEILKDASATAIYGARGANGVVLITTKRGKKGHTKISFEAYSGLQIQASDIDIMNASQYAHLYDEAGYAASSNYNPAYPNWETLGEGTKWKDEIFRQAKMNNYQLSFTGGNENTQYAIVGNYFSQQGIIEGSNFDRLSFRVNLDQEINNKLKIGTHLSLNNSKSKTVPTDTPGGFFPGVVNTALTISPALSIYDETGQYTLTDPIADAWLDNPVAVTHQIDAINKTNRVLGNFFASYDIIKGLTYKSSIGVDLNQQTQDMYTPRTIYSGSWNNGQARFANSDFLKYNFENTLSFNRTINDIHSINLMSGFSYENINNRAHIEIATGFPNDILGYYGIENAEDVPNIYTSFDESSIISYFGRANYSYNNKYLCTFTSRLDGSSKFGKNNRFGFFPSTALAWRLSEEDFIKELNLFSNLKVRASYGISGNENIPSNSFIQTIAATTYYFNSNIPGTGFAPDKPGNDNLKWETTRQLNIGFDCGFFKNRLTITSDYYYKKTIDLLYYADLPYTTGYSSYLKNIGTLSNKGFEFAFHSENYVDDFKWSTDFNISTNKNKILDLKGKKLFVNNDMYKLKIGNWAVIEEGEEMGSFYGLEADGIWQTNEAEQAEVYDAKPGDFKYIDQNNDNIIDSEDRKIIGHALPDFRLGLTNTFSYKNFSLNIFIQGVYGNEILNANRFELESGNGLSNASINMVNRWTPENPSDIYPRANRNADYLHMSDRYIEDGSYIRLKSLSISYNIPKNLLSYARISKAKIYATGNNLITLTNYTGFDPEVGHFAQDNTRLGYDYGAYPSVRTFIVGVVINL